MPQKWAYSFYKVAFFLGCDIIQGLENSPQQWTSVENFWMCLVLVTEQAVHCTEYFVCF